MTNVTVYISELQTEIRYKDRKIADLEAVLNSRGDMLGVDAMMKAQLQRIRDLDKYINMLNVQIKDLEVNNATLLRIIDNMSNHVKFVG